MPSSVSLDCWRGARRNSLDLVDERQMFRFPPNKFRGRGSCKARQVLSRRLKGATWAAMSREVLE